MKARYSSWEEVAHADIEELKDVLRIAGMSGTKPPRDTADTRGREG